MYRVIRTVYTIVRLMVYCSLWELRTVIYIIVLSVNESFCIQFCTQNTNMSTPTQIARQEPPKQQQPVE